MKHHVYKRCSGAPCNSFTKISSGRGPSIQDLQSTGRTSRTIKRDVRALRDKAPLYMTDNARAFAMPSRMAIAGTF
jgi:hypothetical protein